MKIETDIFKLPIEFASYLINGDATGYEDDEIADMDACLEWIKDQGYQGDCFDLVKEDEFQPYNDWTNLGGGVGHFSFVKIPKE